MYIEYYAAVAAEDGIGCIYSVLTLHVEFDEM